MVSIRNNIVSDPQDTPHFVNEDSNNNNNNEDLMERFV